jgi:septal ring factor EnvC (AmiA/AmiB activator)
MNTPRELQRMSIRKLQIYFRAMTEYHHLLAGYLRESNRQLANIQNTIATKKREMKAYTKMNDYDVAMAVEIDLFEHMAAEDMLKKKIAEGETQLQNFENELINITNTINEKMLPLRDMRDQSNRELMRTHDDELAEYYDDGYETDANEYE